VEEVRQNRRRTAPGLSGELAGWLLAKNARRVSVAGLEQTFVARNALYQALERRIGRRRA